MAASSISLWSAMWSVIRRDCLISFRGLGEVFQPVLFFIIVISLFPLTTVPEKLLLQSIGPGIIWVGALLATLLAMDNLFRPDFEDGTLEQLALSPHPLSILILGKTFAHWVMTGLPLILISPLLGVFMHLPGDAIITMVCSLVIGTPALSFIGSVGVALTVGIRKSGVLLSLIILPLFTPILIFGASAIQAVMTSQDPSPHLLLLGAVSLFSLAVCPLASAAAIRISLN